jgi:hypothetical protein
VVRGAGNAPFADLCTLTRRQDHIDQLDLTEFLQHTPWGRFQDIDLSVQNSAECKRHKKQVIYPTIGKPKENDPIYPIYVQFERFLPAFFRDE